MPLFFVPTPLGNLRDVTLRALDALRDADLIVAEDTRVARKLLRGLALERREIWSYRERTRSASPARFSSVRAPGSSPSRPMRGCRASRTRAASWSPPRAGRECRSRYFPGRAPRSGRLLSGFPLRRFAFEGFPPRASAASKHRFRRRARLRHDDDLVRVAAAHPRRTRRSRRRRSRRARGARSRVHEASRAASRSERRAGVAALLAEPIRGEVAFAVAPYERVRRPRRRRPPRKSTRCSPAAIASERSRSCSPLAEATATATTSTRGACGAEAGRGRESPIPKEA